MRLLPLLTALVAAASSAAAMPARAAEAVVLLDLPFKAAQLRGPGSEVALGVATSGLLPIARPRPASADPKAAPLPVPDPAEAAPLVVVWGEGGGAVISLEGERVRTTLLGAEAVEGLAAAETPRGAVPGTRRALAGGLSAYLSGPTRSAAGEAQAAGLTVRERRPLGVTRDPKPVPVATATLGPGPGAAFARAPLIGTLDGRPMVLAVIREADGASALALAGKEGANEAGDKGEGTWAIRARTPPQPGRRPDGAPLLPLGVADFSGTGAPGIAALREPDGAGVLQLWSLSGGALGLAAEAPGYAGLPDAGPEAAALVPPEPGKPPLLALPRQDRAGLALLSLKDGIRETARLSLPAPVRVGLAALGRGAGARLVVGLEDGRVAVLPVGQAGAAP